MASTTPSTTLSRSASSKTINGDLPPSSSDSFLRDPAAFCRTIRPTSAGPGSASFPDGFAVIDGLEHREKAGMFLNLPSNRIQIPRTLMAGESAPVLKGSGGGLNRLVDLSAVSLADGGDRRLIRRIDHLKRAASFDEPSIYELPKTAPMSFEPRVNKFRALRSGAVFHGFEDLFNCWHRGVIISSNGVAQK